MNEQQNDQARMDTMGEPVDSLTASPDDAYFDRQTMARGNADLVINGLVFLRGNGFVPSRRWQHDLAWEVAYSDYYGCGWITLRFDMGALGWSASIQNGYGEHRQHVAIAVCTSPAQMADLWRCLKQFDYDNGPRGTRLSPAAGRDSLLVDSATIPAPENTEHDPCDQSLSPAPAQEQGVIHELKTWPEFYVSNPCAITSTSRCWQLSIAMGSGRRC